MPHPRDLRYGPMALCYSLRELFGCFFLYLFFFFLITQIVIIIAAVVAKEL